jgi:hypothetical protein
MVVTTMPAWTVLYVEFFPPLCSLALLAAWHWGGKTELLAAASYVIATDLQKVVQGWGAPMFARLEVLVATLDTGLFLFLTALAVRTPRTWILCAAALQLLACTGHLAKALDWSITRLAYAIMMGISGYPLLILLTAGVIANARQRRRVARRSSAAS